MWDKELHKTKMAAAVNKVVAHFQSKGISFSPTAGDLDNVVFTSNEKVVKISHHSFYRYSGIACICKDKGDNQSEAIEVTDDMFMNNFMRPIIEIQFSNQPIKK